MGYRILIQKSSTKTKKDLPLIRPKWVGIYYLLYKLQYDFFIVIGFYGKLSIEIWHMEEM